MRQGFVQDVNIKILYESYLAIICGKAENVSSGKQVTQLKAHVCVLLL